MATEYATAQVVGRPVKAALALLGATAEMTWEKVWKRIDAFAGEARDRSQRAVTIWGVPRGGSVVAALIVGRHPRYFAPAAGPETADLLVDDVIDSGRTMERAATAAGSNRAFRLDRWALVDKQGRDAELLGTWVAFPWEGAAQVNEEDHVVRLLELVGEDPNREGLKQTPRRVIAWLREMTAGASIDVAEILSTQFDEGTDEMVVVREIPYWSLCEHHLLPFRGHVAVGYIPKDGKVVGLSKIPRAVHALSRRLQIQERLTDQIATALEEATGAVGVGVVARAHHLCMEMRGAATSGEMVTSCLRGVIREDVKARAEFLALAR